MKESYSITTPEAKSLIKNLDNLTIVVTIYLMITWGYAGLVFLASSVATLFS
jgi:hypothetical protein